MVYQHKHTGPFVEVTKVDEEPRPVQHITVEVDREAPKNNGSGMAYQPSCDYVHTRKRQLEIFEVTRSDGFVGLQFGDGPIFAGYDESDLRRLLEQVFIGSYNEPPFIDAEFHDLAETYLDEALAHQRFEELR